MNDDESRKAAAARVEANPAYQAINDQVMQAITASSQAKERAVRAKEAYRRSHTAQNRQELDTAGRDVAAAERRYHMLNRAADDLASTLFTMELG